MSTTHTVAIDKELGNNNLFAGLLRDSVPQLPEHQQGGEPEQQQRGQDPGGDAGHPPGGDQQEGLCHYVNTLSAKCEKDFKAFD